MVNETSVSGYLNFMQDILQYGFKDKDVLATYRAELALVLSPIGPANRVALLLTANQLSVANEALISNALTTLAVTASSVDGVKLDRVLAAVLLVLASPKYLNQK